MATKPQATRNVAQGNGIPAGFAPVESSVYADNWDPNVGDSIQGIWTSVRAVELQQGRETVTRRVATIRVPDEEPVALWESANLRGLFDTAKPNQEVYIRFDGVGAATKKGYSPPKMYTVALGNIFDDDDIPF